MKKQQSSENNTKMENVKELGLQNTSTSEDQTGKVDYSKLVQQEPLEGIPVLLTSIRQSQDDEWGGWYGVIGRSQITPVFEKKEELIKHFTECGIKVEFIPTLINMVAGHIDAIKAFTESQLNNK